MSENPDKQDAGADGLAPGADSAPRQMPGNFLDATDIGQRLPHGYKTDWGWDPNKPLTREQAKILDERIKREITLTKQEAKALQAHKKRLLAGRQTS
ncbi:MAG: hypothetical protein ABIA47_04710 [bacterium]